MEENLVIIQEARRGYELMLKLQSHINGGSPAQICVDKEIGRVLCEEALQNCIAALHQLKETTSPSPSPPPASAGSGRSPPPIPSPPPPPEPTTAGDRGRKRVREFEGKFTISPFDGGHQWRKYGEKAIAGSKFTRSYYRCGYKEDQKCQAKMKVQQWNDQSPPLYLVASEKEHSCGTTLHPQNEPFPKKVSGNKQKEKFSNINITAQACDSGESSSNLQCDSDPTSLKQEGQCSSHLQTSSGNGGCEHHCGQVDVFASPALLHPPGNVFDMETYYEAISTTPEFGFSEQELFDCYLKYLFP